MLGLQQVAVFLNTIGPRTTQTQWRAFLKTTRPYFSGDWTAPPSVVLEQAKDLRRLIHSDLESLRADSPMDHPFAALVDRLNDRHFSMGWQCMPLAIGARPHDPSQAILQIRWKDGTTCRWTAQSWPVTKGLKDLFYAILGKALESGTLTKLRVCRRCGKYLVVNDVRREVCPGCKIAYQNSRRPTEYYRKRREDDRTKQISQAMDLKQAGASFAKIQEQTGLPKREVERVFRGDLSHTSQRPPKTVKQSMRQTEGVVVVETPEAIVARLRPVIADYYKRMAKLDRKKSARRVTSPPPTKH